MLTEYYTISVNGIVHVWTSRNYADKGDKSTQVLTLSDWMRESTLFNIITNI